MEKPLVSLVRYASSPNSLGKVLQDIDSFQNLGSSQKVLIKPNLVGWDPLYPVAPFGVFTTSRLVEDMVILLKEKGLDDISIGEGSSQGFRGKSKRKKGANLIFEALGYGYLKKKYGVKLIDFFDEPFKQVEVGGFKLNFAGAVFETDYLVNMPAFKTHNQTVLSLGFKNLKGCIDMKSRKLCHNKDVPLDFFCSLFTDVIQPSLTVLDGIYALEKGPYYLGTAQRMNLLIASEDSLGVDVLGAFIAGYEPSTIEHLAAYAERHNRSLNLDTIHLTGLDPSTVRQPLKFDFKWREDNSGPLQWDKLGITGVRIPKYDKTICSGCSAMYSSLLLLLATAYGKGAFDGIEVLSGKEMSPSPGFEKTILFGNCMIKRNRKDPLIKESIFIKGCPVSMEDIIEGLMDLGLPVDEASYRQYRKFVSKKYDDNPAFEKDHYFMMGATGDPRLNKAGNL